MREFVLLALKGFTTPDFNLNNLPEAGRMDLVCRTVSNAFYTSKTLRKDTVLHACLNGPSRPPKTISFYGPELMGMTPDERNIGGIIKQALKKGLYAEGKVQGGVTVRKLAFEKLIKEEENVYYLHPGGRDIREASFGKNPVFVLGDFIGLPRNTEKLLDRLGAKRLSLGPVELFASHCPIIVHNELDRRQT